MRTVIENIERSYEKPVVSLVSTWVLMIPLLVFASQWGFSFEHGSMNTALASRSGDTGEMGIAVKSQTAICYLICTYFVMRSPHRFFRNALNNKLLYALPFLSLLSVLWSQYPTVTFTHAVFLTANIAFALCLLDRFSTNDLLKVLLTTGTVAAIGSLLLIVALPRFGIQERSSITSGAWQGIFPQKNICGSIMTALLLPAFYVQIKSRTAGILRSCYVLVVLAIIAMSRSAGAWLTCSACLLFVLCMHLIVRLPNKEIIAISFLTTSVIGLVAFLTLRNFTTLMYALGKDPTLTGRTTLWTVLLNSAMKHPLLGYGYSAFWSMDLKGESANAQIALHWRMGYAENGVIQLLLELGVIGVLLYGLVFFRATKDAITCILNKPSPAVKWYVAYLFYMTVSNIESGKLLAISDLDLILSLVVFAGLRREVCESEARTRSEAVAWRFTFDLQHQGAPRCLSPPKLPRCENCPL